MTPQRRVLKHFVDSFFDITFSDSDIDLMEAKIDPELIDNCCYAITELNQAKADNQPKESLVEQSKEYQRMLFDEFHYIFMGLERGQFTTNNKIRDDDLEMDIQYQNIRLRMVDRVEMMRDHGGLIGYRKEIKEMS